MIKHMLPDLNTTSSIHFVMTELIGNFLHFMPTLLYRQWSEKGSSTSKLTVDQFIFLHNSVEVHASLAD